MTDVDDRGARPADPAIVADGPTSTVLTRVALPVAIVWTGVLLSAFVFSRLPEGVAVDPARGLATFAGVPILSIVGLLALRLARRGVGAALSTLR